ncbi:hypothetical protein ACS0TY_014050 [Phlomoides rotata]
MQPVGIIVFAAVMATLGFQVLVQALEELIKDEGSDKMSSNQLLYLYVIMLSATGDHYFDVVTNVVGLVAAVLGDKFYWWIDPSGAILLAIYTITNWSATVLENAVDIELPEDFPLIEAHAIGESLQIKIEQLPEVERAFVHLDYECDHKPEHTILSKLPNSDP